jgi:hypothetical protein
MKQNIVLASLVVVGFGCQQLAEVRDTREIPVQHTPEKEEVAAEETVMPIVGFTSLGAVVVFDGRTGEFKSTAEGGGGTPRDVAMDPWRKGVWVFEENEDASGGEIRFCPLVKSFGGAETNALPTVLQPCEHEVWVDGSVALLPTEDGLWVFEDGIGGPRWKVLLSGQVKPSASAPRPASIRMENGEIQAFSYGFQHDRLVMLQANVGHAGPEVFQQFDWGALDGYPPTARYAWLSRDAGLLFDAVSNALTVRRVMGGETGLTKTIDVGMPVLRIEAAVGVGASVLVLGKDALWIVEARDAGVELMSGLWLNGDVRDSPLFFSRDLLVAVGRAFVGTDRGVRAVGLENDGEVVVNAFLDEQFVGEGLRGPLDEVRPGGS